MGLSVRRPSYLCINIIGSSYYCLVRSIRPFSCASSVLCTLVCLLSGLQLIKYYRKFRLFEVYEYFDVESSAFWVPRLWTKNIFGSSDYFSSGSFHIVCSQIQAYFPITLWPYNCSLERKREPPTILWTLICWLEKVIGTSDYFSLLQGFLTYCYGNVLLAELDHVDVIG